MDINALKELINQRINTKTEGEEKIKASEHNEVLHAVVDTLVLLGTQNFKGIASTTTNPGTPAGPVFYLAEGIGSYTHFNTDVTEKLAFLVWDNLDWRAVQIPVDVDVEIDNIEEYLTSEVLSNADIAFKSKDNTYEGVNTFKGPVIVENDIIQKGETYKATWLDLEIKDNLSIINKGEVGSGITKVLPGTNRMFAGWGADRGLRETFYWGLDDTDPDHPQWKIGKADSLQAVLTREDNPLADGVLIYDDTNHRAKSVDPETLTVGFANLAYDSEKLGGVDASGYWLKTELVNDALYLKIANDKIKAGYADLAFDSNHLGGIAAADYWNKYNSNLPGVDWEMYMAIINGDLTTKNFAPGIIGGVGARMDQDGHMEMKSLDLREFLRTPELIKNQVRVAGNQFWFTDPGMLQDVSGTGPYTLTLKIEEGDGVSFEVDDILIGIYNHDTGFETCFLDVVSVDLENNQVVVNSRNGVAPRKFMQLARKGNITNADRQTSVFVDGLDGYVRVLGNVNDHNTDFSNIIAQFGYLNMHSAVFGDMDKGIYVKGGGWFEQVKVSGEIYVTGGDAETLTGAQDKADAAEAAATGVANAAQTKADSAYNLADLKITEGEATVITQNTITTEFIALMGLKVGDEILMGENAVISWDKVTGGQDAIDAIQVGGVNVVNGTKYPYLSVADWEVIGWYGYAAVNDLENCIELTASEGWRTYVQNTDLGNKEVTISFLTKYKTGSSDCYVTNLKGFRLLKKVSINNNDWTYNEFQITLESTGHVGFFILEPDGSQSSTTMMIKDLKVELGNKATSWSPSVKDVSSSIDSVQAFAESKTDAWVTTIAQNSITTEFIALMGLSVGDEIAMGENAVIAWDKVVGTENVETIIGSQEKANLAESNAKAVANEAKALAESKTDAWVTTIAQNSITTEFIALMGLSVGDEIAMGENAVIAWDKVTGGQDAINAIKIGGTNVISGTKAPYLSANGWEGIGWIGSASINESENCLEFFANNGWRTIVKTTPLGSEEITISFFAKYKTGSSGCYVANNKGYNPYKTISLNATGWTYNEFTFILEADGEIGFMIREADGAGITTAMYIRDLKVEKGNKATDWTPAPEDVDAEIATKITNAEATVITENTIATTTVIAEQMKVRAVNILDQLTAAQINFDNATGNNVNLTGHIEAETGNIGIWDIVGDVLQSEDGIVRIIGKAGEARMEISTVRKVLGGDVSSIATLSGDGLHYEGCGKQTYNGVYAAIAANVDHYKQSSYVDIAAIYAKGNNTFNTQRSYSIYSDGCLFTKALKFNTYSGPVSSSESSPTYLDANGYGYFSIYVGSGTGYVEISAGRNGHPIFVFNRQDNNTIVIKNSIAGYNDFNLGGGCAVILMYDDNAIYNIGGSTNNNWVIFSHRDTN